MAFVSGGHIVARALAEAGVDHLFTLCGGHIQMIYDGCLDNGIRVVDTRHEQTAAHAADGWARVTGRPGVAAVTAGPGVTNAVTAMANAARAGVPMLLLGGQGARQLSQFGGQDRGALQELGGVELMRSVSKWSVAVPETRRLAEYVHAALRVAESGVPGPVFLELPLDLLVMGCDETEVVRFGGFRAPRRAAPDPAALDQAAELLAGAVRPVLVVGSQWRWSAHREALAALLAQVPVPVFVNGMARGALPPEHPCLLTQVRQEALRDADLVLLCGTPLDFRLRYGEAVPPSARLVQVDLDAAEIGRNRAVDLGIVGDTGGFLAGLLERLSGRGPAAADWLARLRQTEQGKIDATRVERETVSAPPSPLFVAARLDRFVDQRTIVVGDGGDFVATAAYVLRPRGVGAWMDPGPLGTLGVGPGYAMAAQLARPDHRVLWVAGDGAFGLHGLELEAMVRQAIPVVCVIGNDAAWTQIRRGQVAMVGVERAVATGLSAARYDQVAAALGAHGEWVTDGAELDAALERAFAAGRPAVVNVEIGASEFRRGALAV